MCRKSKVILNYWKYLKINSQGILVKQINTTEQIVLPLKYRNIVYKELHENMGHLGRERVIELCRQRFYWPGYEKDITHYIRKTCRCAKDKKSNKQQAALLQNIITHEPFELVTIDYLHSNHEITPKEPESESDKSETIEQSTGPKQDRRPNQIFTYDTLGKPSYHNT